MCSDVHHVAGRHYTNIRHHGKESTKHYEPESEKTVTELIERKVIAPVDKPTTWCSLAFFVLEADGRGFVSSRTSRL